MLSDAAQASLISLHKNLNFILFYINNLKPLHLNLVKMASAAQLLSCSELSGVWRRESGAELEE